MSINKLGVVEKMSGMSAVVLNVLPEELYRGSHIPGSFSLPLGEDPRAFAREAEWKYGRSRFFITYGSNITSHAAIDAAQALRERGLQAEAYLSGMREWSGEGLPVEGTL